MNRLACFVVIAIAALFVVAASQLSRPGHTLTDAREVQEQCRRDGGTVSGEYHRGVVTNLECLELLCRKVAIHNRGPFRYHCRVSYLEFNF